jgi:hypothetical protein
LQGVRIDGGISSAAGIEVEPQMPMNWSEVHRDHHVKVEIADGIALVTLDRPESRNAVNAAMHRGLESPITELVRRSKTS